MLRTQQDIVDHFKSKKVVLPDEYYGKQQGIARNQAFSIAGMSSLAQIQRVKDLLDESIANGESFGTFKRKVAEGKLDLGLPASRLENIYRTNVQAAFNTGRCLRQTKFADIKPYRLYDAIDDDRTRYHHAAMDGFVAKIDDPIWKVWYTPNGYQCRCKVTTLTEAKAKRFMQRDERRRSKDPDFQRAREEAKNAGPDKGWDYSVCVDPNSGIDRGLDKFRVDEKYQWLGEVAEEKLPVTTMPWAGAKHGKEWHDLGFSESPPEIQNIVGEYSGDLTGVTAETNTGGAHFVPIANRISMYKQESGGLSSGGVWRHEFGHLVDSVAGRKSTQRFYRLSEVLTPAMRKDVRKINKGRTVHTEDAYTNEEVSYNSKLALEFQRMSKDEFEAYTRKLLEPDLKAMGIAYDDMFHALERQTRHASFKESTSIGRYERSRMQGDVVRALKHKASKGLLDALEQGQLSWSYHNSSALPMLSDAFAACSNNKVSGCSAHSSSYFKRKEAREKEIFANLFSLYGDHNPFWRQISERMLPNLTAAFNKELGL